MLTTFPLTGLMVFFRLASWIDGICLVHPWDTEIVFNSDMGVICKSKPLFFYMLHIKRRHLAAIFKAPTSLESYSEKSHVLYMVMLSETGISMHSIELAT